MTERPTYEPERTVYVDMDGVIAGFEAEAIRRVQLLHPTFIADRPRTNFYLADDYPEYDDAIRAVCAEEGFFKALPVIEDALEGWQRMIDLGYSPRVLSAPLRSNPTSEIDKVSWLRTHFDQEFGGHVSRDAIFDKAKYKYDGMALFDDRPDIPGTEVASWSHVVMHYEHNAHMDTDLRLKNMQDPKFERVLDIASDRYQRKMARQALI